MGDFGDDGLDFAKELSNHMEQNGVTMFPNITSEEVFEFPNTLHAEKAISNGSGVSVFLLQTKRPTNLNLMQQLVFWLITEITPFGAFYRARI